MGITGLIPFLEKSSSKVHLQELRGSTVTVDTYCWLHKGVFACAEKLVRGEETDLYLQYCLKYVQMLLSYDIKPILVFDGRHLPAKELTERRRRESRKESKKRAAELLRLGRVDEARSHMRRCVDVTHDMALRLIRECRVRNVDCIVAPYEADAQMAWLNKADLAQYVITEDSDLTLFGAKKIIFKLDLSGSGLLVEADKLFLSMGCREDKYTFEKFRRMCILSGCDYLDSLPGIGLAKACKFILKTEQDDMWIALRKLPKYLNMKNLEVDDEYIESFLKAEATFRHMYIYNPLTRRMERLNALAEYETDERYCCNAGTPIDDPEQAMSLALGNLNPFSLKQLDNWHPDRPNSGFSNVGANKHTKRARHPSIWKSNDRSIEEHSVHKHKHDGTSAKGGGGSCALYFKKVDFIGRSIKEEISATLLEERAKPEEAELFLLYKNEADDHEAHAQQQAKRQRCDSSADEEASPPASPAAKTRHNPFAKTHQSAEKSCALKSPVVCEHGSLLKVLSPKKRQEDFKRQMTRVNSLKRSIFATEPDTSNKLVEVKSRFFAANIKQVTMRQGTPPQTPLSRDLTEEISRIEERSQEKQANLCDLYNSPSPKKHWGPVRSDVIAYAHSDNSSDGFSVASSNNEESTNTAGSEKPPETETVATEMAEPESDATAGPTEDAILLSDDDNAARRPTATATVQPASPFKAQGMDRRLGLPKPKPNPKPKTKATRATKKTAGTKRDVPPSDLGASQTRLSMFGFQKRPILK